jgi:hypothetical protein
MSFIDSIYVGQVKYQFVIKLYFELDVRIQDSNSQMKLCMKFRVSNHIKFTLWKDEYKIYYFLLRTLLN